MTTDDCIIVGGGPAGLTAAIYLTRFRLRTRLFDCGSSRASWIPCTRNHAGYPEGISGNDLLARMREQADKYGVERQDARVERLTPEGDETFTVDAGDQTYRARTVLLATGVVNHRPRHLTPEVHDPAVARGLLRYCPVCDG